jgi:hypothetical protein
MCTSIPYNCKESARRFLTTARNRRKESQYTRCPRTRAPEKKGEIFIKGQINNPNEKCFYVERYSRKEQFNSTSQSILSHPGLFPVIVARLHILLRFQ